MMILSRKSTEYKFKGDKEQTMWMPEESVSLCRHRNCTKGHELEVHSTNLLIETAKKLVNSLQTPII